MYFSGDLSWGVALLMDAGLSRPGGQEVHPICHAAHRACGWHGHTLGVTGQLVERVARGALRPGQGRLVI